MGSICVGRSELADLWRPVQVGRCVRDDPRSPIRVDLRRSRFGVAERKRPTRHGFSAGPSRRGRSKGFNPRGHFQGGWSKMVDPTGPSWMNQGERAESRGPFRGAVQKGRPKEAGPWDPNRAGQIQWNDLSWPIHGG